MDFDMFWGGAVLAATSALWFGLTAALPRITTSEGTEAASRAFGCGCVSLAVGVVAMVIGFFGYW